MPRNTISAPSDLTFANHSFDLNAYQNYELLPSFSFSVPVTVTIYYSSRDVASIDEDSLLLQRWDENSNDWEDAACDDYERHPDENWLVLPLCHLRNGT